MQVELVRTVTRDGLRLDGALASPRSGGGAITPAASGLTAAILLHGVASNFYSSSTFAPLIPRLQESGLAVLAVNTRGHDSVFAASVGNVRRWFGAAHEIVDECRLDIAAWIEFLARRGHERIAVIGHSLGAVKAVYFQAQEKSPSVAAVVAVSPPRLSCSAFLNGADSSSFFESLSTAEKMVREGCGDELFMSKFPIPLLVTAASFLDKYGRAERYNVLKFAAELPCPAVFFYGGRELDQGGSAFAGMPDALTALPNAGQRSISVIDGADHVYTGLAEKLAAEIARWMKELI